MSGITESYDNEPHLRIPTNPLLDSPVVDSGGKDAEAIGPVACRIHYQYPQKALCELFETSPSEHLARSPSALACSPKTGGDVFTLLEQCSRMVSASSVRRATMNRLRSEERRVGKECPV